MSSHREAPGTSKDPVIDSTDLYAFVSPDKPNTVTIIANYIPLQDPAAGPNFFEFGDDVLYQIHVDNNGDGLAEITYSFRFKTETVDPNTFLYNTSTITPPAGGGTKYANFNRPQTYYVSKEAHGRHRVLASGLPCPPCNIGPRSTPNYPSLAAAAIRRLPDGEMVFAGQRAEGFFVDLGSVFDLAGLRPLNSHHLIPLAAAAGINTPGIEERALDRPPDPDQPSDVERPGAFGPDGRRCRYRCVDHGQPPDRQDDQRRQGHVHR